MPDFREADQGLAALRDNVDRRSRELKHFAGADCIRGGPIRKDIESLEIRVGEHVSHERESERSYRGQPSTDRLIAEASGA
jgi:hypothetical protein